MKFVNLYFVFCVKVLLSTAAASPLYPKNETKSPSEINESDYHYEITENIIDVPDTRPKLPIVANYSIQKPLNLAVLPNNIEKSSNSPIEIDSEVEDLDHNGNLFEGIRNTFKELKDKIINSIHTWIKKKIDESFKF